MRTASAAILSLFAMMGMLSPGQAAEIVILASQGVVKSASWLVAVMSDC
jgi:hypothetical protein